jgi:CDP-4-dehydro-6-deoxyglucose reductase, E3
MTFSVSVQPSQRQFNVEAHETVLDAALRAGVVLPYGCKDGACGSCKGKVLSGSVRYKNHAQDKLSEQDRAQGCTLFCSVHANTDLVIECREVVGLGEFPIKKVPCRINSIHKITADVAILKLQLPANDKFLYRAGQYIDFMLKDGERRSYSIANAPHENGPLELHIRHLPGGLFTDHVFNTMKEKDILRFEGPFGTFFLREESDKPIILLASGTGFAPIKALIEDAIHRNITRPMTLYWGARQQADIYMETLVRDWEQQLPHFKFVPVLSEAQWSGRMGLVHEAVLVDYPDLSQVQVYACGAPIMVTSAQKDFLTHGLPEQEFFADAFTSKADVVND